jgi:glucan phosphoethanolaminetransferase (alkaline phosphatase superfamily)
MSVINKKNKYFIGAAVFLIAVFSFVNGDGYSVAALLCVLVSVLTSFDKEDTAVKNPRLMQAVNLAGFVLAALIWLAKIYLNK